MRKKELLEKSFLEKSPLSFFRKCPPSLKQPLLDAISVKKINDRSVATALVIFAHGYEKFIDI